MKSTDLIPPETIRRIAEASDIVAIVGSRVELRRTGTTYTGLCCFHQEKTPSLIVTPTRQRFQCFGCGAGGDAFRFVMLNEEVTFREAALRLAHRAGIFVEGVGEQEGSAGGAISHPKSLLQKLITVLLGGRMASPYAYMTGVTPFNGELFRAEHLVVEDNAASTDIRARRNFGAFLKTITVNDDQPCFSKGRQAVSLTPFWRLSISVNDEVENLMVLPPIDESIADKLILLKASSAPMPMPTGTLEERRAFWARLVSELPAFVDFLRGFAIPANLHSRRFGVTHFHHPDLLRTLDDLAPENQLLELLDGELFVGPLPEPWEGKAGELETRLTGGDSGTAYSARRLLAFRAACGTYLGRLALKHPERIARRMSEGHSVWTIQPAKSGGA